MMMKENNPWAERFAPVLTEAQIRDRVRVDAQPLDGLDRLPAEQAVSALTQGLHDVFVPTRQVTSVLAMFIGMARAHNASAYTSMQRYVRQIYEARPAEPARLPTCLTGLAGVGKSEILKALDKVMPPETAIEVPGHAGLKAASVLSLVMQPRVGAPGVLRQRTESGWADLPRHGLNAQVIYRDGICLMTADEFQAVTAGGSANAIATKTLLQMAQIGPPLVYCANYSLVHSLMKRPQQDRQRLLSNCVIIHPDAPDSEDWLATLAALKKVAPSAMHIEPERDGAELHAFTAGIKRSLIALFATAYRLARARSSDHFGMTEVRQAYASPEYSTHRTDAEQLIQLALGSLRGRRAGLDLVCPFPGQQPQQRVVVAQKMIDSYEDRVTEELVRASLTQQERDGLKAQTAVEKPRKKTATVTSISTRKASRSEQLLAGQEEFLKSLTDS
jgi:energy-coupling factor transporter ATP-binding protein EcfA2